ncbi:MAG TPA: carbamoyltransferase HypF [Actinomycetota bacterium]|nr:carbamoyltransferase HypF [Actinomycetota bacterium]
MRRRVRVHLEGIVQGVGFRPFVHSLASRLGVAGWVGNDTRGVALEAEAEDEVLDRFLEALEREAPPMAVIERLSADPVAARGESVFAIVGSDAAGERRADVAPDAATCEDCLGELFDPSDRRFRYPFINCTNCGPRFTIVRGIPYDRSNTTMAGFAMCEACASEYHDPANRRFHAQPVCCPACGPELRLVDAHGEPLAGDPLEATVALLGSGRVVAVKGLGGYHLAADAASDDAVTALRSRKRREEKPFAVMVPDVDAARRLATMAPEEERLLTSARRPIVLLRRLAGAPVAPSVAPGNRFLGLMLPYTPIHHLLARGLGRPFVLTSGNRSDEPIAFGDGDALERLGPIADAFLVHDRPIHVRTDDSVVREFRGREMVLRRSRGSVPRPVRLRRPVPRPVLAVGAELKNTFALAKGDRVFLSHHIGDLENYETLRSFTEGIEHFRRLFQVRPEVCAHDLHPEYLSTKYAADLDDVELVGVQHHHAHVASCLAENGEDGPAIGVAFDGLGYGTDGTIWGGELLVAGLTTFERAGHFEPVPLPGGAAAIKEPWRMAAAYLNAAYGDGLPPGLDVVRRNQDRWADVVAVARSGLGSFATSSAGRLFDAVAAILGVRDRIAYEGQAAIELEQLAEPSEPGAYRAGLEGDPLRVSGVDLVRAVVEDVGRGVDRGVVAARFHNGVSDAVVAAVDRVSERTGLRTAALSGGVFQNLVLVDRTVAALEARGYRVLTHSRVPPNDGGISLGQVAVAAAVHGARSPR